MSSGASYSLPSGELVFPFYPLALKADGKHLYSSVALLTAGFLSLLFFISWSTGGPSRNGLKIPNGPRGLPFLGLCPHHSIGLAGQR